MKRRDFLRTSFVGLSTLFSGALPAVRAQGDAGEMTLELSGMIQNVHDPVLIKQDDTYYLFSTGVGIPIRQSTDLQNWSIARPGSVFQRRPEETFAYVPGADSIWAPHIAYYNDRYHLYYSVSTFGSNRSAIGLATNTTLHYDDGDYAWVDHGIVVSTDRSDNHNAIDANLALDAEGVPWLVYGSHWSGIKMIRLDYETGKQSSADTTLYALASRRVHPRAVEAPFIIHRHDTYYLFVSFDQCCQGINSSYNVRVGRAEAITGPYEDRDGVSMMQDGGTQITFPTNRYRGPGHNAIFTEGGQDYIVYHAYDAVQGGVPTLRIDPLAWDDDGWPFVPGMEAGE
jgi:arabinan endo-1,5-alpha-L-arabinosidase